MKEMHNSLKVTDAAFKRLDKLLEDETDKDIKLRVYITGGGCSGFQYGFTFDNQLSTDDIIIDKGDVSVVVDPMSLQYLVGSTIDFTEGLDGSRFIVSNPNAKTTCGCGSSFSI